VEEKWAQRRVEKRRNRRVCEVSGRRVCVREGYWKNVHVLFFFIKWYAAGWPVLARGLARRANGLDGSGCLGLTGWISGPGPCIYWRASGPARRARPILPSLFSTHQRSLGIEVFTLGDTFIECFKYRKTNLQAREWFSKEWECDTLWYAEIVCMYFLSVIFCYIVVVN